MGLSREEISRIKRVSVAAQANHKEGLSGLSLSVVLGVSAVIGAVVGFVILLKIAGL